MFVMFPRLTVDMLSKAEKCARAAVTLVYVGGIFPEKPATKNYPKQNAC